MFLTYFLCFSASLWRLLPFGCGQRLRCGTTTMTDQSERKIAVFPGTFDPITNGHLDIIRRGAVFFDELVVAVGRNPAKTSRLDQQQRTEIVRQATASIPNVRVEPYTGLTVDAAKSLGATVILRGLRNASDLQHELQMAMTNRAAGGMETLFMMTSPHCSFIASSLVRQMAAGGGDVSAMVPPEALPHLRPDGPEAG